MEYIKYFLNNIFPLLVFIHGLIGNTFGLILMLRKELKMIGPAKMYQYLFIIGLINLLQTFKLYLDSFGINLATLSDLSCRFYAFYKFIIASILPMILVYISIERYISIKYTHKRFILRNETNQFFYFIGLICFNLILCSWVTFHFDLIDKRNSTIKDKFITNISVSNNFECVLNKKIWTWALIWALVGKLIPNLLIILFTILLLKTIFKSRQRVITNYTFNQNETFRRDVKFAFTSLLLNIIFILLNVPLTIIYYTNSIKDPNLFLFLMNLNNLSFSIDFYLIFLTNSLFREQFLLIFCKCFIKQKSKHKFYFNCCCSNRYKFLIETYF